MTPFSLLSSLLSQVASRHMLSKDIQLWVREGPALPEDTGHQLNLGRMYKLWKKVLIIFLGV